MVSAIFLNKIKGNLVHVDFYNKEREEVNWIEGTLDNFDYDAIEIITETDFDRIPLSDIRKIYLKEEDEKN